MLQLHGGHGICYGFWLAVRVVMGGHDDTDRVGRKTECGKQRKQRGEGGRERKRAREGERLGR